MLNIYSLYKLIWISSRGYRISLKSCRAITNNWKGSNNLTLMLWHS